MKGCTTAGAFLCGLFFCGKEAADDSRKWKRGGPGGECPAGGVPAGKGYRTERIAVEKNGVIVPKAQYGLTELKAGDVLEIVSFVGGG